MRARLAALLERAFAVVALLAGDGAGFAGLAQRLGGALQRRLAGLDGVAGIGQLPLQFLDLGADGLAQHLEPGARLLPLRCGPLASCSSRSLEIVARLALARALPLQLGQRQAQFVGRLREPDCAS